MIRARLWTDNLRWFRVSAHYLAKGRCEERIAELDRQIEALEEERDRLDREAHRHGYRAYQLRESARRTA